MSNQVGKRDSTSRWTPFLLANDWKLQCPIKDIHRQVIRHARCTKKGSASCEALPFLFIQEGISYEKKDIGKGLEKITIIRKKRTENTTNKDVEVKVEVTDDQKK